MPTAVTVEPPARFPQRWALARLDVLLSALIAAVPPLHPALESALFVPAHAFGAPLFSLCILPTSLGGVPHLTLLALLLAGALPLALCAAGRLPASTFHSGRHVAFAAVCSMLSLHLLDPTGGAAMQHSSLFLASWLATAALCWLIKGYVSRPRPAAVLSGADAPSAAPPPPGWLRRVYSQREARWPHCIGQHTLAPNASHSFPSFDAACAACYAATLRASLAPAHPAAHPAALAALVGLACVGRIYFLAHHLLDVLAGAALGLALPSALGSCMPPPCYPWMLAWLALLPLCLRAFFTARRLQTAAAIAAICALGRRSPPAATATTCALFIGVAAAVAAVFRAQSLAVKTRVLAELEARWDADEQATASLALAPSLRAALRTKREAFRAQARHAGIFPGNVHLLGAFYGLPFAASWADLRALLERRLRDWSDATGVDLGSFDVVLGVLTGGAFLAPLAAEILGIASVATIRVSRYGDDVYTVGAMAKVMFEQLTRTHGSKYRVSEPPADAELRGKRVLIVDDASVSGGTLEAAHAHCVAAGAVEARCVALKCIGGYWSPTSSRRPKALPLKLPSFTPWGTF